MLAPSPRAPPVPGQPDGYWTGEFDIRVVHAQEEIAAHLPDDRDKCVLIGEIDDESHAFGIERINPTSTINILHYARGVKTEYELACLRLASRRGARGRMRPLARRCAHCTARGASAARVAS